jgi:glycosyltransferase involved in cell wall biosynthesis
MIDIIVPTCGRTHLLKKVLPKYTSQEGLSRVIIVEDGPATDEIRALTCEKIVTLATGKQSGAPAAKKLGLMHARADFVAFGEDDAFPGPRYYAMLAAHVAAGRADIVAGTIFYLAEIDEAWRTGKLGSLTIDPWPRSLGQKDELLIGAAVHALYLGRRQLLQMFPPDVRYGGNGWREETDPVLSMWEHGKIVAVDPGAAFYHLPRSFQRVGGQHKRSRLSYEFWCIRNDIAFYVKHATSLKRLGFSGPAEYFALAQFGGRISDKVRSRFKKRTAGYSVTLP